MALDLSTLRRPANPQVVDPSTGRMREDWQLYFDQLTTRINASVGALATDPAPADAEYVVAATNSTLSAERVATNTATVEWDFATAGQAKASVPSDAFGDVVGPASSTDNAVALFDGTTGKLLKDSGITVDANGNVTIAGDDNVLVLSGGNASGIELGDDDTTFAYLDFHATSGTPVDFDARIVASGGTGSTGGGTLNIVVATLQHNSVDLLTAGDAAPAWTYASLVNTNSGTAVTIASGLPSSVREIEIMLRGVSTNSANADLVLRLGDSGGFENSGYTSIVVTAAGGASTTTTGFYLITPASFDAATTIDAVVRMYCYNDNNAAWHIDGCTDHGTTLFDFLGRKDLSGAITQLQLTTETGAATFDAGTVSVRYR